MNVAMPVVAGQPAGVSIVSDQSGLQGFLDPKCAASIWDRELPQAVAAWLAELDPETLPNGRVVLATKQVEDTVAQLCDLAGMSEGAQRAWLIGDIANLATCFANLMKAPYVRLRLQAVTTNACRKFHRDVLTGRLVCTYRGTGTQYGLSAQGDEPTHINTTPTGAPILLRGSLWPPQPETGLLHRSPPIEGTGETRLVLVLDPVFDLEDAE